MSRTEPPQPERKLRIRVLSHDGVVTEAGGERVLAAFSAQSCPTVYIGEQVELRFLDGGAVRGRTARARVVSCRDRGDSREIELRTDAELVLLASAGLGLRDDYRVAPPPGERVIARVRGRGRDAWWRALLKDVSITGIGILVGSGTDRALADVSTVEVELDLEPHRAPLRFVGRIRFRGLAGCAIKHGIEILPELTEEHGEIEACLVEYTREQQRRRLRQARELVRDAS